MTDAQFTKAQNAIDALCRRTLRGTGRRGTPEENEPFRAISPEWDAAYALPQITVRDREARDVAMLAVATKWGLI